MGKGVRRRDRIRMKIRGQEVIGIKKGKREWGVGDIDWEGIRGRKKRREKEREREWKGEEKGRVKSE